MAAIIGGAMLGSALLSNKGAKSAAKNPAAEMQARLATQLFNETDPVRQSLIGRSNDFLGGGMDVTATPTYGALRDATARQFQTARDNAISQLPAGGALSSALVGLQGQRASTLAQGASSAFGDEMARAMTLATGQTGESIGGLGQAAQAQGLSAQAGAAQNAAKSGAVGQGLGTYMGNKQGGGSGGNSRQFFSWGAD
jgi:hypothetical protein